MGPVRGYKKRRKIEKREESSEEGSVDWWDEFSKRIAGRKFKIFSTAMSKNKKGFYSYLCCHISGHMHGKRLEKESRHVYFVHRLYYINICNVKAYDCLLSSSKGLDKFESVFKISRKTFNYICALVKEDMMARPGNFIFTNGRPMSLNDQVAVALRRLSSGDSLLTIGDAFGLNHSTVSQVTWRFVEIMEEKALHHLQWPSTEPEITEITSKFEKIRGLPNCCGAIDTTHIMMCLPSADSANSVWLDSENHHSMILQAIVDPEMRFRDIVTGWPGKMKDSSVLQSSNFFKLCEKGQRLNGKKIELSEGSEISEYIVGDSGYPLLPWLVTPYQGKELSESKSEFNKRHFATRLVAQRALARLKEMWKVIQGVMWRPDKNRLPRIILVCCLLHNIVIDLEDEVQDEMPLSHHHDLGYHQQICESVDNNASILRDKLSLYLSGRLPP